MKSRSFASITCVLLIGLTNASVTEAAGKPLRVAVLYFDNNTGDKKLDVLQKGFADMLITDLSQERSLVVVERDKLQADKLQALLGEMKLQRKRYFDKRTALRLGKGLGAQYVISGAFAAMKPQMRIDIRMIKIATSGVTLATTVTGPQTQLFQLEQQLVKKFLEKLQLSTRPRRSGTQVPDVKTLLDYSKAIDLADKGKLRAAELWMSAVAKNAPRFTLAKKRIRDFKGRLKQAAAKRAATIGQEGKALIQSAEGYVRTHRADDKDKEVAKTTLAYQAILAYVPLRVLRNRHLSSSHPYFYLPGHKKQAVKLMKAYVTEQARFIRDFDSYAKVHTKTHANGVTYLDTSMRLPPQDATRAQAANFKSNFYSRRAQIKTNLARFLLWGWTDDGSGKTIIISPPLGVAHKRYAKLGFGLLKEVIASEDAKVKANARARPHWAIGAREIYSDALLLVGQRDAGIAKLQEVLETYPTCRQYKQIERKIKKQLGLISDHRIRSYKRYEKGLKSCGDMDLRVGLSQAFYRRTRIHGIKGVSETIAEIEKACRNNLKARRFFGFLYSHAALQAGRHGYCKLFEKWIKQYVVEGGSPSSMAAYRRNYTKCVAP
ncbi:MAG: hypothetical protein JRH20_17280 [Deltaproteobacteria bacterium]|nr:hypothetical protein [Deltaproteobacteria bacterium]